MTKNFLVVGIHIDSDWYTILKGALSPIGKTEMALSGEFGTKTRQGSYDLIIVDAAESSEMIDVVDSLHKQQPLTPIVVVTASPTWRRARQFFLAGAIDYIRKSLDTREIQETFEAFLANSTPDSR